MDDASGIVYYHHTKTGDVQWEIPAGVTSQVRRRVIILSTIQCSEILTLRNEMFHTET